MFQASLTTSVTAIQTSIITLSQEIVRVQAELSLLTGVSLNLSSLEILTISSSTGTISLSTATVTVPTPAAPTPPGPSALASTCYQGLPGRNAEGCAVADQIDHARGTTARRAAQVLRRPCSVGGP